MPPEQQKVTYRTRDGQLKTVTKAELQDQMESSQKLMQSLNETWEEKLQRTQEVQKERENGVEHSAFVCVSTSQTGGKQRKTSTGKRVQDTLGPPR